MCCLCLAKVIVNVEYNYNQYHYQYMLPKSTFVINTHSYISVAINYVFFLSNLFIRMLKNKNKAQIAQESIKTTLELPGPLSGPWIPAESGFGSALVMCVQAHNLLGPPPKWKSWIRPCYIAVSVKYSIFSFFEHRRDQATYKKLKVQFIWSQWQCVLHTMC